jgi:uncharacterized protein (TIGR03435 family)
MDATHMDAEHIAGVLAHRAGQPVVDKTGLTGTYDFTLSYAPANDANSSLPDFFTALQEQLGLKLQPEKLPVDFLVIDRVDKVPPKTSANSCNSTNDRNVAKIEHLSGPRLPN